MSGKMRLPVEIGILYVILIMGNLVFAPANLGLGGFQPTPYLLPVALIAGRYGWMAGMGASAVGAALYEVLGFLAGRPPNPLQPQHASVLATMLIGGAALGALYDALHRELLKVRAAAAEARARLDILTSHNEMLETANRELRGQIMGETGTIESLYEMAQRLTTVEGKALFPAALDLVCSQAGAVACRFFGFEDGEMQLLAQRGWEGGEAAAGGGARGLIGRAVRERRLVSMREEGAAGRELDATEPIVAVPLLDPDERQVLGVLTVDRLPFTRFTPHAVKVITVIADWTARAMSNVALFSEQEERGAREERALADLIERLRRHTLTRRDLDYLEALAGSMSSRLMEALHSSPEDLVIRSNALLVLERIAGQLRPSDVASLKTFARQGLDELLRAYFEFLCIDRAAERDALGLLRFYLGGHIRAIARQVVAAQSIVIRVEQGVDPTELRRALHPLLDPEAQANPAPALEALGRWAGQDFADPLGMVTADDTRRFLEYNRSVLRFEMQPLERFLLDRLHRRDRWGVCSALHAMGRLGWSVFQWEAFRLVDDSDPYVREAAIAAVGLLFAQTRPARVAEAVEAATRDKDAYVQRVAAAVRDTWGRAAAPVA